MRVELARIEAEGNAMAQWKHQIERSKGEWTRNFNCVVSVLGGARNRMNMDSIGHYLFLCRLHVGYENERLQLVRDRTKELHQR